MQQAIRQKTEVENGLSLHKEGSLDETFLGSMNNSNGEYIIAGVSPGSYSVTASITVITVTLSTSLRQTGQVKYRYTRTSAPSSVMEFRLLTLSQFI